MTEQAKITNFFGHAKSNSYLGGDARESKKRTRADVSPTRSAAAPLAAKSSLRSAVKTRSARKKVAACQRFKSLTDFMPVLALQDDHSCDLSATASSDTPRTAAARKVHSQETADTVSAAENVHREEPALAAEDARREKTALAAEDVCREKAALAAEDTRREKAALAAEDARREKAALAAEDARHEVVTTTLSSAAVAAAPVKPAPAHQRFAHLALATTQPPTPPVLDSEAAPPPDTLLLPQPLVHLLEAFRALDTVLCMLARRQQTAFISKAGAAVTEMTRRRFDAGVLAQLVFLDPGAYHLEQARVSGRPDARFELKLAAPAPLTQCDLLRRRARFHWLLVARVAAQHRHFLVAQLGYVASALPADKVLRRWHPRFALEQPDTLAALAVPEAPLPQPPHAPRIASARDALAQVGGLLTQHAQQVLATREQLHSTRAVPSKSAPTKSAPGGDGTGNGLLARVRAREAAAAAAGMTRDPVEEAHQAALDRLPALARLLWAHFLAEARPALPRADVAQRLADTFRPAGGSGLTPAAADRALDLMLAETGGWLQELRLTRGTFLKVDKAADFSAVRARLGAKARATC